MQIPDRLKVFARLGVFLLITFVLGFVLYQFFFARPPSVIEQPGGTTSPDGGIGSFPISGGASSGGGTGGDEDGPGELPQASPIANGGATFTNRLTSGAVTNPTLTATGDVAYYDKADGRFYTIDENGNARALSQTQFPEAENVVFDDEAENAVIEFPDGSNIIYNFETAKQTTMPAHWSEFSFSGDSSNIVTKSLGNDPSNRALVVTAADGSSTKVIAALGSNEDKVDVSWSPAGDIVGFSRTGEGGAAFGQSKIYTIGTDGDAAGIFTVNGTNFVDRWSPSGKFILYSVADAGDDYRASLWYVDARGDRNGDTRVRLSVKTTADKCTFASEDTLYCAVPKEMPAGGATNASLITSPDILYKISVPKGTASVAAIPAADTQMFNLSTDGRNLYYTDDDGTLNFIQLK